MRPLFKKFSALALITFNILGFYNLSLELFLRQRTAQADWILKTLEKVHFEKSDPDVLQSDHEIHPLQDQEREALAQFLKVDINHATYEELLGLPRVGPAIANRIIEFRSAFPFSNIKDLARIKGIGPKTLEILKDWVRFGEDSRNP